MADKQIKVKVDVDTNVEPTIANLKALRNQLKQTAAGSADFNKLSAQIRDVEDAIEGAKLGAEDLAGSLEAAPGPIGEIFKGLKKVELATKSWGAALKATGIGLLVSLVGAFAAAISKSDETMKKFEPILIGFEKILNGILGALQPVIDGVLEFATKALPVVSDAFRVAYSAMAAFFSGLGKLGSAIAKLVKGDFVGAWKDAKSSVMDFGKEYEAASARFVEGTKKLTKTQKENLDKQKKDRDEAAEEAKRIREAELKELLDGQKEAFIELLSEREAEEYKVNEHYAKLLYLATKYGDDTTQLKLAQQDALNEIDKKYRDKQTQQEEKDREKRLKDADELAKFQLDQLEKIKKLEADRENVTFATNQAVAQSWVDLGQNISGIFGSLINVFEQGSDMAKAFGIIQVAMNAASSIGQILVNSKAAGFEYDKAIATGNAAILSSIPKLVNPVTAPLGIAEAAAGKAAVAGGIAGKAALKVSTALQVGAVGVTSAAQIAAIIASRKSGSGAPSAGANVSSGGSSVPSPPTIAAVAAPQIQSSVGVNPTAQIAQTIAQSQKPIKAYITSGEVSTQIALDRRTTRAATFAGG